MIVLGQHARGVLRAPEAVALAPGGDVYVGDQFSHRIQRFTRQGAFRGSWGSYGDGPGQFGAIGGLASDARGDIYAVDSTHDRVQKFDANGRFLRAWGSHGHGIGQFDFGHGGGPDRPPGGGIAVGGTQVFVSDTANNRIQRFGPDGSGARAWGQPGHGRGQLALPRGLAVTANAVYVADDRNRRVDVFTRDGRPLSEAGSFGRGPGQFADPYGVAVGRAGRVYVADDNNNRVVVLSAQLRYLGAWRTAGDAHFSYLRALATDPAGRVYVADAGRNRIEVLDPAGTAVGGWGVSGKDPGQFIAPHAVAASRSGEVLVAETFGARSRIDRFGADLEFRSSYSGRGDIVGHHFFNPAAVAAAPDRSLWVADRDNDLLRHLSPSGALLGLIGASAGPGQVSLRSPTGVAVDRAGVLYVADAGHRRVLQLTGAGRVQRIWGGPGGQVRFGNRMAVAVGPDGAVYVADTAADRILRLGADGGLAGSWGGRGSAVGRLREPAGVTVDGRGDVFVSDTGNHRIQRFGPRGAALGAWGHAGTAPGQFSAPEGLSADCRGELIVADTHNNRVEVFRGVAATYRCAN